MVKNKNLLFLKIIFSVFIGLCLEIIPLPQAGIWIAPKWSLLILIYWIIEAPFLIGITAGFILGLLNDLLTGSLLGEHAFAFIVIAYIATKLSRMIRVYPIIQQTIIVSLLVLLNQFIIFLIQCLRNQAPHTLLFWFSIISSAIIWPLIYLALRKLEQKIA